jgi:hypothetical protein
MSAIFDFSLLITVATGCLKRLRAAQRQKLPASSVALAIFAVVHKLDALYASIYLHVKRQSQDKPKSNSARTLLRSSNR